ncbi:porin [Halomonas sp. M5N1S17]|uniref:porin n=1 Tax=Halomonas alkalisoli TaxID=2907158 RepID=UPI001F2D46C8|nr:porin [Halomonas alkalisoli]MCE9665630.1 porin [Halomonas alkalisoli]
MSGRLVSALVAVSLILVLSVQNAQAQLSDAPSLTLNGFGTLGIVHSDEDQAAVVSSIFARRGAGHSSDWSAEVDSRLGLQLTADLTPSLSSVVQVVSEQRYDGSYRPVVEWANVKFDATPDISLRLGRVVLPTFMSSEYRKVGYATPWVRPPQEVYRTIPVSSIDGIDASYRHRFGAMTNTLRATYGQTNAKFPYVDASGARATGEAESREGLTLGTHLEWRDVSLFAAYSQVRLTIEDFTPLFDIYRLYGPQGEAIADRYDIEDKRFETISLGASLDRGDWFVMGELAQTESRTFIADTRGWYVTGGYRLGSVTPYLTYARHRILSNTSTSGLSLPGTEELDAFLDGILSSQPQQTSVSLGVRWDFSRNMALKAQLDHINHDAGSHGFLVNSQPGFEPGGTVNLFSLALDFVF